MKTVVITTHFTNTVFGSLGGNVDAIWKCAACDHMFSAVWRRWKEPPAGAPPERLYVVRFERVEITAAGAVLAAQLFAELAGEGTRTAGAQTGLTLPPTPAETRDQQEALHG